MEQRIHDANVGEVKIACKSSEALCFDSFGMKSIVTERRTGE